MGLNSIEVKWTSAPVYVFNKSKPEVNRRNNVGKSVSHIMELKIPNNFEKLSALFVAYLQNTFT
jgi:hypothetical protein